jgi:pimeloyl-ACP methyl ester carboxylesterase
LAAEGWDVTAVDLPGHGLGPRPVVAVDNLATLVEATVATLPASVTVLAGHSLGAVLALAAAASHPGLTRGVFAEDPPGQSGVDNTVFAAGVEALAEAVRADRNAYWRQVRDNHPQWDDDDVSQSVAAVEAADAPAIAYALRGGLTWDLPALVSSARVPVMVVAAGTADGSFAGEGGSALRGADRETVRCLVPEERFIVLEGGHSLHRERAGRLSGLISDFAGTLAPKV